MTRKSVLITAATLAVVGVGVVVMGWLARSRDAREKKAIAALYVGTYRPRPQPGTRPYDPPPVMTLSPDGTFVMTDIPGEWLDGRVDDLAPRPVSIRGTWRAGDDGDGSWEFLVAVTWTDGKFDHKAIHLRPEGETPVPSILFSVDRGFSDVFFRVNPGE